MLKYNYREYNAEVLRVIDGDTIEVKIDLGFGILYRDKIRLLDFDAPETWRPKSEKEKLAGIKCKEYLRKQIEENNNQIVIQTFKKKFGKYKRILARIIINERDIINEMIELKMEKKYVL